MDSTVGRRSGETSRSASSRQTTSGMFVKWFSPQCTSEAGPNTRVQPTADSLRCAPASGNGRRTPFGTGSQSEEGDSHGGGTDLMEGQSVAGHAAGDLPALWCDVLARRPDLYCPVEMAGTQGLRLRADKRAPQTDPRRFFQTD